MSAKPKKRIAPTLVNEAVLPATNAFEAAAKKKNPLENAADLIAMRYGISGEAPQINEDVFAQNRAIGKKVIPLKEYFEQTAKDFKQKEALQKEEVTRKKQENAKLSPCQRKLNTLQRNIDGYIQSCDPALSNDAMIEMMDQARTKARTKAPAKARTKKKSRASNRTSSSRLSSASKKGGRR
jgi:hypothetical protein